ncbi:MAG: PEGA domain-containing protein [Bacteroidales bacterium]|jgi:hypothetical protein|nr:PEGA domain-containing protein [Bacteroidales bacterium]
MKKRIYKLIFFIITLFACVTLSAQNNLSVESFTEDETDQDARISSKRKDQNDKVCAIVKIETPLLLQDFTFDAGMTAVGHSEQKTGEIWLWLSPGALRLTINHKYLGTIRNYAFGEALKEATVYIMKLKSGSVKTVVEPNVALQYIEIHCAIEGATVKIDNAEPEPFTDGEFQKLLSYGKHKYTVEAPMYHPESGIAEINAQKSAPVSVALKPKFGKLVINTQPEQGADVFIDDEKRGKSPLTIEKLGSGQHKIHAVKLQFLPAEKKITVADGASELLTLNLSPNFAVITLTTPDGGDIYINDKKEGSTRWSGRLTQGQYKVEVVKPSHRNSVKAIEVTAGIDKTISLEAPVPIYGSLNVTSGNINAAIFIDGKKEQETTPVLINKVIIGKHEIELQADGYMPYRETVDIPEGKIFELKATLQEKDKDHVANKPLKYDRTRGPSNAFLSMLVPGLGVHKVTGKEKNGVGRTLTVYGIIGASIGCKLWSNSEYKKYHDATEQSAMDKHYNMANGLNKTFYIGMAIGATVWLYDIIWVAAKGAKNKKENKAWQQRHLGFYYNPKLNVSGLSYTINF